MNAEHSYEEASGALRTLTRRRDALLASAQAQQSPVALPPMGLQRLEEEISQARQTLGPMTAARSSAVRESFAQPMRDAARRALAALAEAESAILEINSMRAEVRRVGGVAADLSLKLMLPIRQHLRAVAGEPQ